MDKADFNRDSLTKIWGLAPPCLVKNGLPAADAHHIMGRGYEFGVRPSTKARAIFSSVFNAAPLSRIVHEKFSLNSVEMRCDLLRWVADKVTDAMRRGDYEATERDERFLIFLELWAESPNDKGLLKKALSLSLTGRSMFQ